MRGLPFIFWRRAGIRRLESYILVFFFHLVLATIIVAENRVYVDVVPQGQQQAVKILNIGKNYEFRVWIENDIPVSSLRITLRNWITTSKAAESSMESGTYFTWLNVGGYGPSGIGTGHACVTAVPGSRIYPPEYVWDFSGTLRVWEYNMNEVSPDTIGFGGTAVTHGLAPGPLQHMVSIHFRPNLPTMAQRYLHLDSAFVSPFGGILFYDQMGTKVIPSFSTEAPWSIKTVCGDVNADGSINISDPVHLISYIFKGGPAPIPPGSGDVNCDTDINIADIVHLISYIFRGGEPPCCM